MTNEISSDHIPVYIHGSTDIGEGRGKGEGAMIGTNPGLAPVFL